jgi:hypothetical protein
VRPTREYAARLACGALAGLLAAAALVGVHSVVEAAWAMIAGAATARAVDALRWGPRS